VVVTPHIVNGYFTTHLTNCQSLHTPDQVPCYSGRVMLPRCTTRSMKSRRHRASISLHSVKISVLNPNPLLMIAFVSQKPTWHWLTTAGLLKVVDPDSLLTWLFEDNADIIISALSPGKFAIEWLYAWYRILGSALYHIASIIRGSQKSMTVMIPEPCIS